MSPNPFRIGPTAVMTAADWHERGVRHDCLRDPAAAIACYRTALAVGGPNAQIAFDLAYALTAVGKIDAAIERYRQVLEIDSHRQDAWTNLGELLITAGDAEAGIDALHHATRLDPDDPIAHYNLADAFDGVDPDRASHHWQAFLRTRPGSSAHVAHALGRLRQMR